MSTSGVEHRQANEASIIRLIGPVLQLEQNDGWQLQHRYGSHVRRVTGSGVDGTNAPSSIAIPRSSPNAAPRCASKRASVARLPPRHSSFASCNLLT
jgi:hypothetical protein